MQTNANQNNNSGGPSPAFIKATIKIAHPEWTPEQVEAEFQKKISEQKSEGDEGCEFCSS
jgi:hypothetical protein